MGQDQCVANRTQGGARREARRGRSYALRDLPESKRRLSLGIYDYAEAKRALKRDLLGCGMVWSSACSPAVEVYLDVTTSGYWINLGFVLMRSFITARAGL